MIMIMIIDSKLECNIYKILILTNFRVLVSEHEQTRVRLLYIMTADW